MPETQLWREPSRQPLDTVPINCQNGTCLKPQFSLYGRSNAELVAKSRAKQRNLPGMPLLAHCLQLVPFTYQSTCQNGSDQLKRCRRPEGLTQVVPTVVSA